MGSVRTQNKNSQTEVLLPGAGGVHRLIEATYGGTQSAYRSVINTSSASGGSTMVTR